MFLKTKVKADSITNLTDARYFAAAGVEWIGFSLTSGMSIEDIQAIIEWLDGVKIVLEISGELTTSDYEAIETIHPDFIQVDIHCNLENIHEPIPVIKKIDPSKMDMKSLTTLLEENVDSCDGFVIDLALYSWDDLLDNNPISPENLNKIIKGYSCLLKLSFTGEDINKIINRLQPDGICLEGSSEEKVGYKSFESLDELLEILTIDE